MADVPDMDEPSSHAGNGMGGTRWTGDAIGRFKSSQLAHSYISTYYPLDSSSFQSPRTSIHTRVIILYTHTQLITCPLRTLRSGVGL